MLHLPCHGRAAAIVLFLSALPLLAQVPDQGRTPALPAPPKLLQAFDVNAGTVQQLDVVVDPAADFVVDVELAKQERHLVLRLHDVRTPDFRLLVNDATGLHQVPTPPCVTYQGTVLDDPLSSVAATIVGNSMTATVHLGSDEMWIVQPVQAVDDRAGGRAHLVYRASDRTPLPWRCGVNATMTVPPPEVFDLDVLYECQLAIEADFPYYQLNGSNVTTTQNDITGVINSVTSIYNSNVQITYLVTQIIVNSTTDPYTSSVAGSLLNQFANYWNSFRGGVVRDTAHLFTGRPMGQSSGGAIGIATLGTICNTGSAYGVSQSRFSANFAARVAVTAHELGHNWNAQHCDPVPPCHIMCSGVGGCAGVLSSFSTNERNQIIAFRQTRGCLTQLATSPVVVSAVPNTVTVFQPAQVVLNGTGFTGTTQFQVGTVVQTTGFQVLSDTQIRITPPQGLAIGPTTVRVTNPSGTSNTIPFNYSATDPCRLTAPSLVLGGNLATFEFGGRPNDIYYLLVSLSNTTSPMGSWPVLSNLSILSIGALDSLGLGSFSIPVPPGILSGLTVYSQVLDVHPLLLVLVSSSNVGSTFIFM